MSLGLEERLVNLPLAKPWKGFELRPFLLTYAMRRISSSQLDNF